MTVVKYCKATQTQRETGDKSAAVSVGFLKISAENRKMKFSGWESHTVTCLSLHPLPKVCRKPF